MYESYLVRDEEIAFIEAVYASVSSSSSSILSCCSSSCSPTRRLHNNAISINSITLVSKQRFSSSSSCAGAGDIEDTVWGQKPRENPLSNSQLRKLKFNIFQIVEDA
jgi:hypothetical protein